MPRLPKMWGFKPRQERLHMLDENVLEWVHIYNLTLAYSKNPVKVFCDHPKKALERAPLVGVYGHPDLHRRVWAKSFEPLNFLIDNTNTETFKREVFHNTNREISLYHRVAKESLVPSFLSNVRQDRWGLGFIESIAGILCTACNEVNRTVDSDLEQCKKKLTELMGFMV